MSLWRIAGRHHGTGSYAVGLGQPVQQDATAVELLQRGYGTSSFVPDSAAASVESAVQSAVHDVLCQLQMDPDPSKPLPANAPLTSLGVNSTAAVSLTTALEAAFALQLPATLVFDYPSIQAITEFIEESGGGAVQQHASMSGQQQPAFLGGASVESAVQSAVHDVLGQLQMDPDPSKPLPADAPLTSLGVNSTAAVSLTTALAAAFALQLPATLVFDYPSIQAITEFIEESGGGAVQKHASMSGQQQPAFLGGASVESAVQSAVYDVLGQLQMDPDPSQPLPADAPLTSLGVNSTAAVSLTTALEAAFALQLPATLVFDYPSIQAISEFIIQENGALVTQQPPLPDSLHHPPLPVISSLQAVEKPRGAPAAADAVLPRIPRTLRTTSGHGPPAPLLITSTSQVSITLTVCGT